MQLMTPVYQCWSYAGRSMWFGNVCQRRWKKVGMKVTDSTRSQGNMAVTYKPLSDSDWQELGASDPGPWHPVTINCRLAI